MKKKNGMENFEKEQVMLSLERTILSKERTVLAEITVLLAFMTLGVVIIKLFENAPNQPIMMFGFALLMFSGFAMLFEIFNFRKYTRELKKIEKDGSEIIISSD
ncbi:MAG: DUF202 domain-containing protein [Candidatus Diapherotrites archaeon]|nr:DUF202 domain-containing protein [Candidatus Diapherotrites archaeon]